MMTETCIKCQEYIYVNDELHGKKRSSFFHDIHHNHPLTIIDERELDPLYNNITRDLDKEMLV